MNLDETLSSEMVEAVDMGVFALLNSEGKKSEKYPELNDSQFADSANRAFPIDTAEKCRAAVVYLNKYFNSPSAGGVTVNYSEAKFKQVHNKIVSAMSNFGIEHSGCAICDERESRASKDGKGGKDNMPKDNIEDTDTAEWLEAEATASWLEAESIVNWLEAEASEEEEVLDSDVEPDDTDEAIASWLEAETTVEWLEAEATSSWLEAERENTPLASRLREALEVVSELIGDMDKETAASTGTELSEEDQVINELAETKAELDKYKVLEKGSGRVLELVKAGIEFDENEKAKKAVRFGSMSDEDFGAYKEDMVAIATKGSSDEEDTEPDTTDASLSDEPRIPMVLNVEDSVSPTQTEEFKKIYEKD